MKKLTLKELFDKRILIKNQLSEVNKQINNYDLLSYVLAYTKIYEAQSYDRWSLLRFFMIVDNEHGYKNFDAWRLQLDMKYAKEQAFKHNKCVAIFDDGIYAPSAITQLGDRSDRNYVNIIKFTKTDIECEMIHGMICNVTGKCVEGYSGKIVLNIEHVMNYFNTTNKPKPGVVLPKAPQIAPLMMKTMEIINNNDLEKLCEQITEVSVRCYDDPNGGYESMCPYCEVSDIRKGQNGPNYAHISELNHK